MNPLEQFLHQLHSPSLLIGLATGTLFCLLLFLVLAARSQRQQLILSFRLEQLHKTTRHQEEDLERLRLERASLAKECRLIDNEKASLQTACTVMRQQVEERDHLLAATRQQIEQDFQLLAGRILTERSEQLGRQHETALHALLHPLHHQLQEFKRRIDDIYDREARDRTAMIKEIEQLKQLNQQVSADASNLATALKGKNKMQGQWGEMLLEKLLEASGLRSGKEYRTQVSLRSADGALLQPDVVVSLPDRRAVLIDAKVSLKAYVDGCNEEQAERRQPMLRQHVDSIRKHISQLAAKQYHQLETGSETLDFILLFIPIEGAFQLAVELEPDLLLDAMQKKVLLSSPSTLLAVLRTIHHLWRLDQQNRNSLTIAKQAGNLYDKFVGFTEAFEEIGLRLTQAQQSWHTARNRLISGQGSLVSRTQALKELGVQPGKDLPDTLKQTPSCPGESS